MKQYRLKPEAQGYAEHTPGACFPPTPYVQSIVDAYPEDWEEVDSLNELAKEAHKASAQAGWYDGVEKTTIHKAVKLALIHSEISEVLEGERKGLMDKHLPHRPAAEVELADAVIRILDYAGWLGYDIGGAIAEKMEYNLTRPDHTREARAQEGGKKI